MNTKTITQNRTLSKTDARLLATLSERGQEIFTAPAAAQILGQPSDVTRKRLHRLVQRRWLQRLEKGKYLIVPLSAGMEARFTENELVIAAHLVAPYYVGYRTALIYYGWTEQPARTIYIATPKRKAALRLHGLTFQFVTLNPSKFFGHGSVWIGEKVVEMADKDKALVDAFDHPEWCGGLVEVAKALWRGHAEFDWEQVAAYGERLGNRAVFKRLGLLLELFDLSTLALTERLQSQLSTGYAVLDPLSPKHGKHNARWRVLVNLPENELLDWRET